MKSNLIFLVMVGIFIFMTASCARVPDLSQLRGSRCCEKKDYEPQIVEDFRLDIKGYSKAFNLNLKYLDSYSLGITNGDIGFPEKYRFKGKLKLQFFYKNKLIREAEIEEQDIAYYMTTSPGFDYREINLAYFDIPLDHRYKNNLSLKVTVIEPDPHIAEFGKDLKIVIGVSGKE